MFSFYSYASSRIVETRKYSENNVKDGRKSCIRKYEELGLFTKEKCNGVSNIVFTRIHLHSGRHHVDSIAGTLGFKITSRF